MADEKEYLPVSMLNLEADTDEITGYNPEADANAMLPPVPAGRYSVLVSFAEADEEKRFVKAIWGAGANQQSVVYTSVVCKIYGGDDSVNDRTVGAMISSYTSRGTNSIQGVIQALGYGEQLRGQPKTRTALVMTLSEALMSEAHAEIDIDWEVTEKLNDEEREAMKAEGKKPWRKQGMTRFEKDTEGNYIPEMEYKGVTCRAYNIVDRWVTVGSGQPAGATQQQQPAAAAPTPAQAPKSAAGANAAPTAARPAQAAQQTQAAGGPPVPAGARRPAPVGGARR